MAQLNLNFTEIDMASLNGKKRRTSRRRRAEAPRGVQLGLFEGADRAGSDTPSRTKARRRPAARLAHAEVKLEAALRRRIGMRVLVKVHENRSTMISYRRRGRALFVRVHKLFEGAPEPVLSALASFVSDKPTSQEDARLLDVWIDKIRSAAPIDFVPRDELQPVGEHHDLSQVMARLNKTYFGNRIRADITWTRSSRNQRRTSIHLGTYLHERRLIRVHPALDQWFVPAFFVEYVVFHEMLHQVHAHDRRSSAGRREIHTLAFREDERRFRRFFEAEEWERRNLARLLSY